MMEVEDGSWWRATRKTQFHFSFRKRQAKYKCKGKSQKKNQNLSTTKGNTRPINSRTINVVCVCVNSSENRQRCELKYVSFFRSNENKFMCDLQSATIWCEFRSTGFPCTTTHVTQARGGGGGISWSGVLC